MPDSIATLRPNGTVYGASFTIVGGGGATAHGVTSDDDITTYIVSTTYDEIIFDMTTFTLPALAQVRSVTTRASCYETLSGSIGMNFQDVVGGVGFGNDYITPDTSGVTKNYTFMTYRPQNYAAQAQANIDAYRVGIMPGDINHANSLIVREVFLDVAYNQAPVVSSVAIDSAGNPTPKVTWAYTDPEGDVQERYRVKFFDAATYGGGGFNADTSTAAYDSGETYSSLAYHQSTGRLTNGTTYKAYVKVSDLGSSGRYSAWVASGAFTSSYTVPTAANISALTATPSLAKIVATVTDTSQSATPTFERSTDNVTFTAVRSADVVLSGGAGGTWTMTDYEATHGTMYYRVRFSKTSAGFTLYSNYSTVSNVAYTLTDWWLVDPITPANNLVIGVKSHKISTDENLGEYSPLGRTKKVVVGDTVRGDDGQIEIYTTTVADWTAFKTRYRSQTTFWLVNPDGEGWYVRFTKRARERTWLGSYTRPLRTIQISYDEVDAP